MDNTKSYYFCDKCHKPMVRDLEYWHINLCSECASKLYWKIYGDQQKEK